MRLHAAPLEEGDYAHVGRPFVEAEEDEQLFDELPHHPAYDEAGDHNDDHEEDVEEDFREIVLEVEDHVAEKGFHANIL